MARDIVCSAEVDEKKGEPIYVYEGQTYYFCAPECRDQFIGLIRSDMNSLRGAREDTAFLGEIKIDVKKCG